MKKISIPCLILLLSFTCNTGFGQGVKAVLVKLHSEKNRISYFDAKGDRTMAENLRNDAEAVRKVTIADFRDHFVFCPVYYFIDTNQNNILMSNFTGVLLDETLQPVSNPAVKNGDTDLVIVYYGIPDDVVVDNNGSTYKSGRYPDDGLVILGHDMKPRKRLDYFMYESTAWNPDKQYSFTSRKFAIEYKPWAERAEKKIEIYNNDLHVKSSR